LIFLLTMQAEIRMSKLDMQLVSMKSDALRWESIVGAIPLWRENPIFGKGLGAFVETREKAGLETLVIHSVPVWLLAETGLFGVVLVGAAFFLFIRHGLGQLGPPATRAWGFGLISIIVCFVAAGLVHDVFYQRVFWFLLGLFATAYQGATKENGMANAA